MEVADVLISNLPDQTACDDMSPPSFTFVEAGASKSCLIQAPGATMVSNPLAACLNEAKTYLKLEEELYNVHFEKQALIEILNKKTFKIPTLQAENDSLEKMLDESVTACTHEKKRMWGKKFFQVWVFNILRSHLKFWDLTIFTTHVKPASLALFSLQRR